MKRLLTSLLIVSLFFSVRAISPYIMVGELQGDMKTIEATISEALSSAGFTILGSYNPSNKSELRVIVYTSDDLKKYCQMADDRGMLAAALKIGLRERKGVVQVSMLNPEYLFYVYLRDAMDKAALKSGLEKVNGNAIAAMRTIGTSMEAFGGDLGKEDLKKYRYMMGMPRFDDPVTLREFSSFQQGLSTISRNLDAGKGNTVKVFEIIDETKQVALIGVGLLDPDKGEAHFLSIIGEKNVAAMPYEIIIQGNTATMLHGRFRFASHWPELTMGTFTKIMSSPGDVEEFLKALTE